ncbi:MAG: hypothetical protein E3J37_01685 [Anaerolineales bacterium]|nr:MAG: hypothetical protein E3J37_01685 [Anaerolineales bacterium]
MKSLICIAISLALATGCTRVPSTPETHSALMLPPKPSIQPATPSAIPTRTLTPTSSPTPTPVCTDKYGRVEVTTYPGFVLPEQIPVRIYLPPCYAQDGQRYPVLYLLHGFPFDESHWGDLGVDGLADEGIGSGTWPPFIIVMPRQPEPLFTSSDGGPGSYEAEIVEGLVSYIDRTYRTDICPEARALGGISRGGVWALEVAFRHPNMFDIVAALSPALHMNYARPPYDPLVIVRKDSRLPGHIFLSAGDQEVQFRAKVEKLSQTLEEIGIPHMLVIGSGGHDAELWITVIQDMLNFIVAGWLCCEEPGCMKDSPEDDFRVQ